MSALEFRVMPAAQRFGLKGAGAADWLASFGIAVPSQPNTWSSAPLFVARLGTGEFFIEDDPAGNTVRDMIPAADAGVPGVYPVLREDAAFLLSGEATPDVLAQICNVDFSALALEPQPVIMTSMIGVSVLVAPYQPVAPDQASDARRYRIWCDPTFGGYMAQTIGHIVVECGGNYSGVLE